jgi:glucose-1-phosphate adenylyltransferase
MARIAGSGEGAAMRKPEDALVLLLAGGVGSRLNLLVEKRAKPAVTFGGIYRIIDFSLSNVMNSGLTRVGVLTQYKPLSLMSHIGMGEAWDFTGRTRGVKILPPRTGSKDSDWYQGTADAVRRNVDFIEANEADEVVILSGDHIYHMDFDAMLEFHRAKKADVTVGMMVVPMEQIHQFGAGITNDDGRIVDWEEKPEVPKTNLASMGIYVFTRDYLLKSLARSGSEIDFGMHILPWAIEYDNVFAYPFYGYWRDVGTIQAYWEANMDLLKQDGPISLERWQIRTNVEAEERRADRPAARYGLSARVDNSLISAGCVVNGTVINSVLSPGVVVGEGALVKDSILFRDCVVETNAGVDLVICDKFTRFGANSSVGIGDHHDIANRLYPKHLYTGITLVGEKARIPEKMKVGRNCIIKCNAQEEDYVTPLLQDGESLT